jgi:Domain of unknown function (DUF4349)
MKVIRFPGARHGAPETAWAAELEAALDGAAQGPSAESWRELRADVRSLTPPLNPALESRLRIEIDRRTARTRRRAFAGRLRSLPAPALAGGGLAVCAAVVVLALVITSIGGSTSPSRRDARVDQLGVSSPHTTGTSGALGPVASSAAERATEATTSSSAEAVAPPASTPGRVQQLSASLSLSTTPANVQATSDGVARLATREGGYVASSHTQVQSGAGEASLTLRLPSAHLGAALAAIGRLAPVRSESQSLQDITNTYNATRQRLGDARAERQALLRALAKASTAGEIGSLHERLAANRGAIASEETALRQISRRASNSEVEVTVLATNHAAAGGTLTLRRGLHDAGRVLSVALAVLVIAAAALVPLALLCLLLVGVARLWRRYTRERVLEGS